MSSGTEQTPGDYIAHHLTNLRYPIGEGDFWVLNLDSIIMGWLLGVIGIGLFYVVARRSTRGAACWGA
jgi:F-type H+-transporting ATPase subunit a